MRDGITDVVLIFSARPCSAVDGTVTFAVECSLRKKPNQIRVDNPFRRDATVSRNRKIRCREKKASRSRGRRSFNRPVKGRNGVKDCSSLYLSICRSESRNDTTPVFRDEIGVALFSE